MQCRVKVNFWPHSQSNWNNNNNSHFVHLICSAALKSTFRHRNNAKSNGNTTQFYSRFYILYAMQRWPHAKSKNCHCRFVHSIWNAALRMYFQNQISLHILTASYVLVSSHTEKSSLYLAFTFGHDNCIDYRPLSNSNPACKQICASNLRAYRRTTLLIGGKKRKLKF
jgi:hypothetical protein